MSNTPACRILTLSSSLDTAFRFVDRIKSHTDAPSSSPSSSNSNGAVPWTISNKYYTADVHFDVRNVREWNAYLAQGEPAVIFVWASGQSYKEHVEYLARELADHEPEVCLAVRILPNSPVPDQMDTADDDDTIDDFLSTHGFEFVDDIDRPQQVFSDGVPGLPRVVDALSTIMWPSMVQADVTFKRKSRARELLDWAQDEEEADGLRALVDEADREAENGDEREDAKKSRMQKEMEELERWLEEDEAVGAHGDPWTTAVSSPSTSQLPVEQNVGSGFDDDFTVFVSAPAPDPSSGRSSPDPSTSFDEADADKLLPMHTGASYQSLASVSDFEEDNDPDIPSRTEIEETAERLFGPSTVHAPPLSRATTARAPSPPPSATPTTSTFPGVVSKDPSSVSSSFDTALSDDEADLSAFDLSRVLGALQGMKEEIAGMSDEKEKRRAAARVALGLVYGLERDAED